MWLVHKNDFDCLVIEDLKELKKNKSYKKLNKFKQKKTSQTKQKRINNFLQYWSYGTVIDKLERLSEEEGFLLVKVNQAYTSQTCSNCGSCNESFRDKEHFHCKDCGLEIDADTNAAINILLLGVYNLQSTNKLKFEEE